MTDVVSEKKSMVPEQWWRVLHLVWCFGGIMGSLVVYGVLQERIMQQPFGDERFTFSLLLVLLNRLTTCSVAFMALVTQGQSLRPAAPAKSYAAVSLSNVAATFCQYEALKHVSFAVQTLGKCAKMLPVMVWGTMINRKRYGKKDYGVAVAVMLGCALFLTSEATAARKGGRANSMFGLALMGGYLGFDGFTSTFQDALFRGYDMTIFNQMLYITAFSALLSLSGLVASGQIFTGLAFFSRHPDALISALVLSAAATVGQMFISHTIKSYGALLFATAMTTRQFVSILLSAVIFGHAMSKGQLLGACLVFGALYAKTFASGHKGPVLPAPQTAGLGPAAGQVEGQPLLPVHEPLAEAVQEKNAAN